MLDGDAIVIPLYRSGPAGVDGPSAYQIAVAGGFVGTQAQWLASLKGQDGGVTGNANGLTIIPTGGTEQALPDALAHAAQADAAAGTATSGLMTPSLTRLAILGGTIAASAGTPSPRTLPDWLGTLRLRDAVNVRDFSGFDPTGTSDSTAAFLSALATGRSVRFDGTPAISGVLRLLFDGQQLMSLDPQARLVTSAAAGNIIEIGNGTDYIINAGLVGGWRIWSTVVRNTGTYAVLAQKLARGIIDATPGSFEDQTSDGNRLHHGIGLDTCSCIDITRNVCGFQGTALACWAAGNSSAEINFWGIINGGSTATPAPFGRVGVHVGGGVGGLRLHQGGVQTCGVGVLISTDLAPGVSNREVFIHAGFSPDSNRNRNILVKTNSVLWLEAPNVYSGGAGTLPAGATLAAGEGVGLEIVAPQLNPSFSNLAGMAVTGCQSDGLVIGDGNVNLTGLRSRWNGRNPTLGGSGVRLKGTARQGVHAFGVITEQNGLKEDGTASAGGGYGWAIETGADNFILEGGAAVGNVSGPLLMPDQPAMTRQIKNILGLGTRYATYTPTVTANSGGTFGSVSATGQYLATDDGIDIYVEITIADPGSAVGGVGFTLPPGYPVGASWFFDGQSRNAGGYGLIGTAGAGQTQVVIFRYDVATPILAGAKLCITGHYRVA